MLEPNLAFAAALGSGLLGGVFFAFSNFVMPALGTIASEEGMRAMQRINLTVLNPGFFAFFLGTAALSGATLVLAIQAWGDPGTFSLAAASVLYLAGCLGVTVMGNVPMNDKLADEASETTTGIRYWSHYSKAWTRWNHLRTTCCLLAAAGFLHAGLKVAA